MYLLICSQTPISIFDTSLMIHSIPSPVCLLVPTGPVDHHRMISNTSYNTTIICSALVKYCHIYSVKILGPILCNEALPVKKASRPSQRQCIVMSRVSKLQISYISCINTKINPRISHYGSHDLLESAAIFHLMFRPSLNMVWPKPFNTRSS